MRRVLCASRIGATGANAWICTWLYGIKEDMYQSLILRQLMWFDQTLLFSFGDLSISKAHYITQHQPSIHPSIRPLAGSAQSEATGPRSPISDL